MVIKDKEIDVMTESIPSIFYRPSWIHRFFRWVDRLPGPYWLFYIGIMVVTGLLNHIVAWYKHVVPLGEINWYFAFTAFFFAYYLFALDINFRVAKESIVEFITKVNKTEDKNSRVLYEFTHLPARESVILFLIGAVVGIVMALYELPFAEEINHSFLLLEVTVFSFSIGVTFLTIYVLIRSARLIRRLFRSLEKVDIYDLNSIYAISKYSALYIGLVIPPTYLIFVLSPTVVEDIPYFILTLFGIGWILVFLVFWPPLRYVNQKIVSEKKQLLKDVNLRIKNTFELVHSEMDAHNYKDIGKLRDVIDSLKKEKDFIGSISSWPWKTSTLTGLLSAIVIPLLIALLSEILSKYI
jgi:hypothetical protein